LAPVDHDLGSLPKQARYLTCLHPFIESYANPTPKPACRLGCPYGDFCLVFAPGGPAARVTSGRRGVVPGGALDVDGGRWVSARPTFLFPVRALPRAFCHRLLTRLDVTYRQPRLVFPTSLASVEAPTAFQAWAGTSRRQALGRLCEAAVWRTRNRPRRPRSLHPPRRDLEPSAHRRRGWPRVMHLSRPPAW